ncbi:MAG: helix-turn-helix transcriptional regulator [Candidatus Dormibacteraeota bacterium]|nr:helix-turn-helix transcriptional regulator [Candidatus Dormibacteraeota bacterium]
MQRDVTEVRSGQGSRLRRERELRGWSQAELARRLGASDRAVVGRWERGEAEVSPHFRARLCELFGLNAEELGLLDDLSGEVERELRQSQDPSGPAPGRIVVTGLYLLAFLAFLLPFVTASCGGRQVASLTGQDLAVGDDLGSRFGTSSQFGLQAGYLPPDGLTLVVWLLPVIGLALVWLGPRLDRRLAVASVAPVGAVGAGSLLWLLVRIHNAGGTAARQTGGSGHIDPAFGFFVALGLFAAITAWGGWCLWRWGTRRSPGTIPGIDPDPGYRPASP